MTWRNPTPEEALRKREKARAAEKRYQEAHHEEIRLRRNARRKKYGRANEMAYNKAHPELGKARQERYMSKPGNKEKGKARYKNWWNSPAGLAYRAQQNAKRRKPDSKALDRAAYKQWWKSPEGIEYQRRRGPTFRSDRARVLQRKLLNTQRRAARLGVAFDEGLFAEVLALEPPERCESCGYDLDYKSSARGDRRSSRSVSIDRVDNAKSYLSGNVAFICARCNAVKTDATADELRAIAAYIDRRVVQSRP